MVSPSWLSFFYEKYFFAGNVEIVQESQGGASRRPFVKWQDSGWTRNKSHTHGDN
ncbi:hypothetical protein J2Z65_000575 [Paenibacillus aceris]|uniref:Uncharacterized protein n=1 Tax=Paenibacillus aceris TaxID=869555 RepID=A0ABS4HRY9_9BACL|nr:hypothetical protein [Paenibacillus aceris]